MCAHLYGKTSHTVAVNKPQNIASLKRRILQNAFKFDDQV